MTGRRDKPRQARSEVTRERLLEATLDVIYAEGLRSTTIQRVIEAAGLSRGAVLYHFPTRDDLIEAAVIHSMTAAEARIRENARLMLEGRIDIAGFVRILWQIFSGRFQNVAMEHMIESRTNAALREKIRPSVQRFHDAINEIWTELYRAGRISAGKAHVLLNMTLCLIRGMQIQTIYRGNDPAYYEPMIETWSEILSVMVAEGSRGRDIPDEPAPAAQEPDRQSATTRVASKP